MAEVVYDLSEYDTGDGTMTGGNIYQPAIDHFMASVTSDITAAQIGQAISRYEDMIARRRTQTVDIDGARVKLSQNTLRALVEALRTRMEASA